MIKILNKKGEVLMEIEVGNLGGADLSGADLSGADLRDASLSGADLSGADLRGTSLYDANLSWADLRDADLRDSYLRDADMSDADLRDSDLRGADLRGADLRGADLRGADLGWADLRGTSLIIITWSYWSTYITKDHIRIGCKSYTLSEWRGFSDSEISSMDSKALDFWKQNKELIISLCERFDDHKNDDK